jgi:hypothetical protein
VAIKKINKKKRKTQLAGVSHGPLLMSPKGLFMKANNWGLLVRLLFGRAHRNEVHFLCVAILSFCCLMLVMSFLTFDGTKTIFGEPLGADFAGFYSAGKLLDEYPGERLYDIHLHNTIYHEVLPGLSDVFSLPYVYPPFFGFLILPLAYLPYSWAYLTWLLLSIGLSVSALQIFGQTLNHIPKQVWPTCLLLALAFEPLVVETWLGGQSSFIALFAIAFAIKLEKQGLGFYSGLALAICLYKPPLLFLVVPMIAIARQSLILAGFLTGAFGLGLLSLGIVGFQGIKNYINLLKSFSELSSSGLPGFPLWKFVDLNSFFIGIRLNQLVPSGLLVLVIAIPALIFLGRAWFRFSRHSEDQQTLLWTTTITWTLVLNLYVGVYDSILAILGMMATANYLYGEKLGLNGKTARGFQFLLVGMFVAPWLSQPLARLIGFQPYTLGLVALAAYQLALLEMSRTTRSKIQTPPPSADSQKERKVGADHTAHDKADV